MNIFRYVFLSLAIVAVATSYGEKPLTTADDILAFSRHPGYGECPFEVTAKVVVPAVVPMRIFSARVGKTLFTFGVNRTIADQCPTNAGEIVHLKGLFRRVHANDIHLDSQSIEVIGFEAPEIPQPISIRQFFSVPPRHCLVSLSGTIRDTRPDEIDPNYSFLTMNCGGEIVHIALCIADAAPQSLVPLSGSDVTVTGVVSTQSDGQRSQMGRYLYVSHVSDIVIRRPGSEKTFDVPPVSELRFSRPSDLLTLGRYRASGTILAAWDTSSALLKTDEGTLVRVNFLPGPMPGRGTHIEVSGFPETDFLHLRLTSSTWREAHGNPLPDEPPLSVSASDIFLDDAGRPKLHPELYGKTIRLHGSIMTQPKDGSYTLSADNQTILLNATALADNAIKLPVGSIVEISGICIMDAESWRPDFTFPHIRSVMIVPRTPSDIRILRRPPWWTPLRFATVIGSLLIALLAILIWNRSLRRLAAKRGQELADKTIAQAESELKVYERTRLATELHDSIAQILTGVAFKLETVDRLAETDPTAMRSHLGIAIRSLQACRDDLRNCLWDLRNHALEIPDMDQAIRRTLEQQLEGTDLAIRFNVPRERLSDNTTHEILCIIRELVLNAIRHGHATEVRVAGAIEDDTLRFSVADNGCGFDPDSCPGMREGHYGLQGVRERAAHLGGEFTIRPNGTAGMKAVVSIKIIQSP